jgi:hypothetical protein
MYTAIIIEFRQHPAFLYVIKNALSVLECNIIIYHGNMNKVFVEKMIEPLPEKQRITLVHLKANNFTPKEYSVFLKTNKDFYASIPTDTFLVFQTDSILFEKNKEMIHRFLHYDYVGAPWGLNNLTGVGNGGLSIRNKLKMLEIIEREPYNEYPEDVFFAMNKTVPLYKPSVSDAKHFSVEHIYEPVTFGSHKPWLQKHTDFYKLYPELVEFGKLHGK